MLGNIQLNNKHMIIWTSFLLQSHGIKTKRAKWIKSDKNLQ